MKTLILASAALVLATSGFANLLRNSGFEQPATGSEEAALHWKMNDPDDRGDAWGSAVRRDWRAHDGAWMIAVSGQWAELGDYGGVWQDVEAEAGTTYILSAWVYADGSWTADTQELKIEFFNEDRSTQIGSETVSLADVGEVWTRKDVEAMAPEGTRFVRVVVNVAGAGQDGALQVDDLDLETAW